MVKSSIECPGWLKCFATGFSTLFALMSFLWPLSCMCRAFHVLLSTPAALNEVDKVVGLAGSSRMYCVRLVGDAASECVCTFDVLAGFAAF